MTDYNTSLDMIAQKVKQFRTNRAAYRAPEYKEADARQELIDPLFVALGWDVHNDLHVAPQYREVIPEKSLDVEGQKKAPDYAFRQATTTRFFVEAKKPGVPIKTDAVPAYQLRRYAWSAKLPLSLLTDFEELAVYDCRSRPSDKHKASVGRRNFYTFEEYPDRWREIWDVFSREAVWGGSFDQYIQAGKGRGTSEVDTEFLREIEGWRETLARNMELRNQLGIDDLNDAVQRTIDRVIFLRMAEDRHIEPYEQLCHLANKKDIYAELIGLCRKADAKYNAGLFDLSPRGDPITPKLSVDDKVLKPIITSLYFPQSPYEFSVLPIRVLGNIYEQFLGKVIRLTASHQAKVDPKPEVRKAGGVFYTPEYIVDYIVKNTVGKLVEGKSSKQLAGDPKGSPFRALDMACGSGSFLLGVYQLLLDYYLHWYIEHTPKHPNAVWQHGEEWRLTITEKKRILTTHIFGVDIDRQAVEVTKLSLLLKVLEGESTETLQMALPGFQERALPNLDNNIKCGNSLIGPDYFTGQLLPDADELRHVNPFDWEREFPEAMKAGGFDCVIGNPPYIFTREQHTEAERNYFSSNYEASWEKHNTFMLFMQLMLRLLKRTGKGGFIVPNSWLTIESAHLLRGLFIPRLELVADLNYKVFEHVSMEPCIFVISGSEQRGQVQVLRTESKSSFAEAPSIQIDRKRWLTAAGQRIVFSHSTSSTKVIERVVSSSSCIGDIFDVRSGLQAYEQGKGGPPQTAQDVRDHVFDRTRREDENSFKYLQGKDVGRYELDWSGMWLQYGPWLSQPRELPIFTRPRVLLREITSDFPRCLNATYVRKPYLNNKSILNVLHPDDNDEELKCLLGIMNSKLMSLFYRQKAVKSARKIFPKVVIKNLREFPYPDTGDIDKSNKLIRFVDRMLVLHEELALTKSERDRELYQRQIDATDREIDKLVYELYGLTDEEIKIVEGVLRDSR